MIKFKQEYITNMAGESKASLSRLLYLISLRTSLSEALSVWQVLPI